MDTRERPRDKQARSTAADSAHGGNQGGLSWNDRCREWPLSRKASDKCPRDNPDPIRCSLTEAVFIQGTNPRPSADHLRSPAERHVSPR